MPTMDLSPWRRPGAALLTALLTALLVTLLWLGMPGTHHVTRALADDPDLAGPGGAPSARPEPVPKAKPKLRPARHRARPPAAQEETESDEDTGSEEGAGTAPSPEASPATPPPAAAPASPESPMMTRLQELMDRRKQNGGRLPAAAVPAAALSWTPRVEGTWEFYGSGGAGSGRAWVEQQTGDSFRGSFKSPLVAGKFDGEMRDGRVKINAHWSLLIVRVRIMLTADLPAPGTNPLRLQGRWHSSDGREGDFVATRVGD